MRMHRNLSEIATKIAEIGATHHVRKKLLPDLPFYKQKRSQHCTWVEGRIQEFDWDERNGQINKKHAGA